MEAAVEKDQCLGALSLDWSKFFDSLERDTGNSLVQYMLGRDSNALGYVQAERTFTELSKARVKVGKAVQTQGKTRGNGFLQGPCYSIEVALMMMSVWTRAVETEADVQTTGFVDDSAVRSKRGKTRDQAMTNLRKAWEVSKEFGSKAGTKCNRKKVKMIASDEKTEKELEREFEEEELKCTKAFVLVGGTMTTCTASSRKKQAQIRDRRMEKYERVLERCKQIPGGFEQKAMALQVFATPVLTFDSELTLYTETTLTRLDRKVHAMLFKSTRWRSQALTFILLARGHLVHPGQAVRYCGIRTVRRVLRQRTDLQEIVKELIRTKEDKEEGREEARGPVSVLLQHMKMLGWTLSDQLVITRKYGTKMHLTKGEDQLFDHWLREDLRRAIWSRDQAIRNRKDLKGIAGSNIDYASTVQLLRAKKTKKRGEKIAESCQNPSIDEPGGHEYQERFKLNANLRGSLRSILGGAVPTGERLHRAKLRKTALCPFCLSGDIETTKHMWWECTATEECRQELKKEVSQEDLDALPEVTKNCGIILDDPELDEWFSRLAGDGQDEEETWPPREEDDCSDFSYDSDGFLKVAGDGACPSGQGDLRLRGSGAGVYYGRGSKHNSVIPIQGAAQGAQRAEIRAALRWALWAWSKTVYLTDSQQVKSGIEAILQGKKKKQKSHRDLWRRIAAALQAKGLENHKVEKVKAHQHKKQRNEETMKQASARTRNEEADKRAVEAAARNAAPNELAERRKKIVKIGKLIQTMMLQIMEKRGQIMKSWVTVSTMMLQPSE